MATNIPIGQGGLSYQNDTSKTFYVGTGTKNSQRVDVYGNVEMVSRWATTSSASLTLTNPSEYLVVTVTGASQQVGITLNSNTTPSTNGTTASLVIPQNAPMTLPMLEVTNINYIASSASVLLTVANFY